MTDDERQAILTELSENYTIQDNCVVFGTYEQDNDLTNGTEPIEWEVLGEDDNGVLVVSKYILDCQQYNIENTDVTWETCTLRSWLNDTFYATAFTTAEQARINTTTIVNTDNLYYGTEGGNDTQDNIFCLSVDEILNLYLFNIYYEYEYYFGMCQTLIVPPTAYAKNKGVDTCSIDEEDYTDHFADYGYTADCIGRTGGRWWLRSPSGSSGGGACVVLSVGEAHADEYNFVNSDNGVRPALYIKR